MQYISIIDEHRGQNCQNVAHGLRHWIVLRKSEVISKFMIVGGGTVELPERSYCGVVILVKSLSSIIRHKLADKYHGVILTLKRTIHIPL